MEQYPVIFEDAHGKEESVFFFNGSELSIQLRGIEFTGNCFESLEAPFREASEKFSLTKYSDNTGELTNCRFQVEIPVQAITGKTGFSVPLTVDVQTGETEEYGLKISTNYQNQVFTTQRFGFFEDAIVDLQQQIQEETDSGFLFKICLSCGCSSYHPVGSPMFGGLYCFKQHQEEIKAATDKTKLMDLFDIAHEKDSLLNVQETYLCDEYQYLTPGMGYKTW